ncbi:MAG TPA: cation diffusion facilitator family transporter [Pseudomonadales bacterium]|nr:cation diffusion facilitator family transporter [Pseudomonadales bacterium]HMW83867.1 cation diffusion facilitator family transporter [Pseudomonadales bacterium]HMY96854.1 cation diffusion facilitator family transporter [Pseudomonadales bacterium]HMZ71317.1 cation diffusion facilitator family transporter [Pseudomonadales bacterium]HMZ92015.1 cation diffusion facilitator family transporter [Pseudomonadales bacterium]
MTLYCSGRCDLAIINGRTDHIDDSNTTAGVPPISSAHHHGHDHGHHHAHQDVHNLKLAFFLNLGFALLELIGALLTNSLAVASDALHDLGDSLALGLAWFLGHHAERRPDQRYSYGYRRFSLMGALINSAILLGGSLYLLLQAVPRLLDPQPVHAPGMILLALLGIAVNGAVALRLRGGRGLNSQVISWHFIEDLLGWLAVLCVSILLLFKEWPILDPLLSIGFTLFILYNVHGLFKKSVALFLQGVPDEISLDEVLDAIRAIDQVADCHHTHVWSMDGEHHVFSSHLVLEKDLSIDQVLALKEQVRTLVLRFGFSHSTVELEYPAEQCRMEPLDHDLAPLPEHGHSHAHDQTAPNPS